MDRDVVRVGALTPAQRALYEWHLRDSQAGHMVVHCGAMLRGPLDLEALASSFDFLEQRHEPLRTTYHQQEAGRPVAHVHPPRGIEIEYQSLADVPMEHRAELAQRFADSFSRREFDLEVDPPIAVGLLQWDTDEHVFIVALHHICTDGWSLRILLRELSKSYGSARSGGGNGLGPLKQQCVDVAREEEEWIAGPEMEEQLRRSVEQLLPVVRRLRRLPSDHPLFPVPHVRVSAHKFKFPTAVTNPIPRLCSELRCSPFMLLLSAYIVALHHWDGRRQLLVETLAGNRLTLAASRVLGAHINAILIPFELRGDPTLDELVESVRSASIEGLALQRVPFASLRSRLEELGFDSAWMCRVSVRLDQHPLEDLQLAEVECSSLDGTGGGAPVDSELEDVLEISGMVSAGPTPPPYDLALHARGDGDDWTFTTNYMTDLFAPETIDALVRTVAHVLSALGGARSRRISEVLCDAPSISRGAPVRTLSSFAEVERIHGHE